MSTDQHRRMQANFRLTHDHKAHPEYRQALDLLVDTAISHAGKDRVTMDHALSDAFSEAIKLIAPSLLEQVPPVQVAAGDTLSEDDVRRHHPPYTGFDHLDTVPAADRWTRLCILPEGTVILDPESGYIWVCAFGNLGGEDRWALAYPHHESDFDGPTPSIPYGPGPLIVLHRGQGRLR